VDRLAGNDPETFSFSEAVASQETFSACCPMVGNLHAIGEHGLPREV
jgi:hypothetical protein